MVAETPNNRPLVSLEGEIFFPKFKKHACEALEAGKVRAVGLYRAIAKRDAKSEKRLGSTTENDLFEAMQACAYQVSQSKGKGRFVWQQRWMVVRDFVVQENLGLAFSSLSRFRVLDADWEDLRSEALFALVRAVEGFDPWAGFRFSTYACQTIFRGLAHAARKAKNYRIRFPVEHGSWMDQLEVPSTDMGVDAQRLRLVLRENRGGLTAREAIVLEWRFPSHGGAGMTLGDIGKVIGLSKERVRQIQQSALSKLRAVIDTEVAA